NQRQTVYDHTLKKSTLQNIVTNTVLKEDSSNSVNYHNEYSDYLESFYYSSKFNFGDKIYFNLNTSDTGNPYKLNGRLFPVEFDYPFTQQRRYCIIVPAGYVPKVIPKNLAIALPGNAGKFIFNIIYSANQLVILFKLEISTPI